MDFSSRSDSDSDSAESRPKEEKERLGDGIVAIKILFKLHAFGETVESREQRIIYGSARPGQLWLNVSMETYQTPRPRRAHKRIAERIPLYRPRLFKHRQHRSPR